MTAESGASARPETTGKKDAAKTPDGGDVGDDNWTNGAFNWLSTLRARLGLLSEPTLRHTLESVLKEEPAAASAFSAEEREMLLRLLRFGASRVEDIMVPRADIIAIDESQPVSDVFSMFQQSGVSRIVVFHETLDDPRGMVHVKDLFRWTMREADANGHISGENQTDKVEAKNGAVEGTNKLLLENCDVTRKIGALKLRRPVLYVPPSMPAMNLLIRMQTTRNHMALVVDEYGGTDGLVTIEDLVEQIVGDIEDEHDEVVNVNITGDAKRGLVAAARTPVEELEAHLGIKLLTAEEEEDIDTLGGLVFTIVGRVPARGELVRHSSGLEFEVLDADPRRVKTLKIHLPPPDTQADKTGEDITEANRS